MGGFKFDKDQWNAIDKANQIGTPFIKIPCYPKLGDQKVVIAFRIVPVYHSYVLDPLNPIYLDRDPNLAF